MQWLAVAIGGSLGALCRYGIATFISHTPGKLPLVTLSVNIIGCFLMGVFFVLIIEKNILPLMWRQFVMVGFLGALTTFSTFSMESLQLLYTGHIKMAFFYTIFSMIATILATFAGYLMLDKLI